MEYFDVVDCQGMPTGKVIERTVAHRDGIRHRTVHIWVIRKRENKIEVLLQKRCKSKDSFPGRLDTSSAGHIQAGDEPLPSAVRELGEELGISVTEQELCFAGTFDIRFEKKFHSKIFKDNEIAFVYVLNRDIDICDLTLQAEEVEDAVWMSLETVYSACKSHDKAFCVPIKGLDILKDYIKTELSNKN